MPTLAKIASIAAPVGMVIAAVNAYLVAWVNLGHYAAEYGWLDWSCVGMYLASAGGTAALIGWFLLRSSRPIAAANLCVLSVELYFLAALTPFGKHAGPRDDFFGLAIFWTVVMAGVTAVSLHQLSTFRADSGSCTTSTSGEGRWLPWFMLAVGDLLVASAAIGHWRMFQRYGGVPFSELRQRLLWGLVCGLVLVAASFVFRIRRR